METHLLKAAWGDESALQGWEKDPAHACDTSDLSTSLSASFVPHPHKHLSFACGTATEGAVSVSLYLLNSFLGAPHPEDAHRLETWETERLVLGIPTAPRHPGGSLEPLTAMEVVLPCCTRGSASFPAPGRAGKKERFWSHKIFRGWLWVREETSSVQSL